MFTGSMMKLKKHIIWDVTFYYTKVFEPSSPKLAYYDYFRKRGYTRYPYDFAAEYLEMSIAVLWDKEKELPYVMHRGSKRLYFPREYSTSKIEKCYRALLIEQDVSIPIIMRIPWRSLGERHSWILVPLRIYRSGYHRGYSFCLSF